MYFLSSNLSIITDLSDLFNKIIAFLSSIILSISLSSSESSLDESSTHITSSALSISSFDFLIPILSTKSSLSLIPAVSVRFILIPDNFICSLILSLVVPATSVTIAFSCLLKRLSMEDFPTLGFPTITVSIPSFIILPLS